MNAPKIIFKYLTFFRKALHWKFYLFVMVGIFAGLTEGIGISFFIPLLNQADISQRSDNFLTNLTYHLFEFFSLEITINNVLIFISIFFTLSALLKGIENVLRVYITSSIKKNWQEKISLLLGNLRYDSYINSNTGYYSNLIVTETGRAIGSFTNFCNVLVSLINISVYLLFSLVLSWKITLVCTCIGVMIMVGIKRLFVITEAISKKTTQFNSLLQEDLIQILQSMKYLKATGQFHKIFKKIRNSLYQLFKLEIKQSIIGWILKTSLELSAIWMVIGVIFYQTAIMNKNMSAILILILFFHKTIRQINVFPTTWNGFLSVSAGLEIVTNSFIKLEKMKEINGSKSIDFFHNSIDFKNVNFFYGSKQILFGINANIRKNSTIALVGESGAGKSTFVDLLTGILSPTEGEICIDDISYSELDLNSLRKRLGYVTQDIIIYNDSIKNNITLWDGSVPEEVSLQKVEESLHKAYCSDFIKNSENGMMSHIGDRGVKLSVGQRQRISIARELYKEIDILICDEATSALDTKSEKYIQESIYSLKHKMTIILIAHRLSTIIHSDYIYVFDKGRIIEEGTYNDLYSNEKSRFRKMCDLQSFVN